MEMELICEDLKFLGFALHSLMFSLCVHVVGANDGVKLLEVRDKRWQLSKAKALLHYRVFHVFSNKIVFVVVALKGKCPKCELFNWFGHRFPKYLLHRIFNNQRTRDR